MGLIEKLRNRLDMPTPNTKGDEFWSFMKDIEDLKNKETVLVNNIALSNKYMDKAMKFTDLSMADRYEVVKNSLNLWYIDQSNEFSNNPVKSNEISNLASLWEQFTSDPITRRSMEAIPRYQKEHEFMEEFSGLLAAFFNANGIDNRWYIKTIGDFSMFYFNRRLDIITKGQMAILLEDKIGEYVYAEDYLKAYKIWARNFETLDRTKSIRRKLWHSYNENNGLKM